MKDKILMGVGVLVAITILGIMIFVIWTFSSGEKIGGEKIISQTVEERYASYLEKNLVPFPDGLTAVMIDFDYDNVPELLLRDSNSNRTSIKILYLRENQVYETEEYTYASLVALYNIEDETRDYYIKSEKTSIVSYFLISDLLKDGEIKEVKQDALFSYSYVPTEMEVEYFAVTQEEILKNVTRVSEKIVDVSSYIDIKEDKRVKEQIKFVKDNLLNMDANGIYNNFFRIAYGTYISDKSTFTIKSDKTAIYTYTLKDEQVLTVSGTYSLVYDEIRFVTSGTTHYEFKLKANNQFIAESDNSVWDLKIG